MGERDEASFDLYLAERLQDRDVRNAYEDALARSVLLEELVAERKRLKLSQAAVARYMDTTPAVVSDIENGRIDLALSTLQRYARAFGASLSLGIVTASHFMHIDRYDLHIEPTHEFARSAHKAGRSIRRRTSRVSRTRVSITPVQ